MTQMQWISISFFWNVSDLFVNFLAAPTGADVATWTIWQIQLVLICTPFVLQWVRVYDEVSAKLLQNRTYSAVTSYLHNNIFYILSLAVFPWVGSSGKKTGWPRENKEKTSTKLDYHVVNPADSRHMTGRQGSLVVRVLDYQKVASSNPQADKVQICHSAPEQTVNPLFLGRHWK